MYKGKYVKYTRPGTSYNCMYKSFAIAHAVNTSPVIGNFVCYGIDSLKIMYMYIQYMEIAGWFPD